MTSMESFHSVQVPKSKLDSSIEYNNSLSAFSPDSSFRSDEAELKGSFYEKSDTKNNGL